MRGLFLTLVLVGSLASDLSAQSVRAGGLPGPWTGDEVPWFGYATESFPPLLAGQFTLVLPAQPSLLDLHALSVTLSGVGWTWGGPDWSTTAVWGLVDPVTLDTRWNSDQIAWIFPASAAFATWGHWGRWEFGGGAWQTRAGVRYIEVDDAGSVDLRAWGGLVRWSGVTAFFVEATTEVKALVSLLAFNPFALQGEGRVRIGGIWADPGFEGKDWSAGLGLGAALLGVEGGTVTATREWLATVGTSTFPFFQIVKNQAVTRLRLEADPAWVVVFRPRASWELVRGVRLEAARWLPLGDGLRFGEMVAAGSDPVLSGLFEGTAGAPSAPDPRNLWWAGLELSLNLAF